MATGSRLLWGLFLVFAAGCEDEGKDPDPDNGGSKTDNDDNEPAPSPSWAVGDDSAMLRIEMDGSSSDYDLRGSADLLGIACHGTEVAWAVGSGGTLIYTHDAGRTWAQAPVELDATLRAVAISASHVIIAAGDDGSVIVSRTRGADFTEIVAPPVDFTAVATDADGEVALLTANDGSIWRYEAGAAGLTQVWAADAPLRGIAMTGDGEQVVSVGDDGTWLTSTDGGITFEARDVGTDRDLYAVRLSNAGALALAVGGAGSVVRWDGDRPEVQELLDDETDLRAVHLSGTGHGIAVGESGVAFVSHDAGQSWSPLGLSTTRDLYGVDEIGLHGHL